MATSSLPNDAHRSPALRAESKASISASSSATLPSFWMTMSACFAVASKAWPLSSAASSSASSWARNCSNVSASPALPREESRSQRTSSDARTSMSQKSVRVWSAATSAGVRILSITWSLPSGIRSSSISASIPGPPSARRLRPPSIRESRVISMSCSVSQWRMESEQEELSKPCPSNQRTTDDLPPALRPVSPMSRCLPRVGSGGASPSACGCHSPPESACARVL
uniref:Uncharacterized protein n=1 Tax=uncultured marine group II/III euryarchaeote KM3_05_H10 TaxID=1457839 RepID=A0A075G9Z4_9EURY|nr:hypothetical protein [uncultured marine group II/III euryarchaeote KM3_05_H10]